MLPVGRDVDEVPWIQLQWLVLILEQNCRRSRHQDNPLVLFLVVPEVGRRGLAAGDDSLD
jgi:hypothetical protein